MDDEEQRRAERAAARRSWSVRVVPLSREGEDEDLSDTTTASERLGMMWQLALDAWASSGRALPSYSRRDIPGKLIRRDDGRREEAG